MAPARSRRLAALIAAGGAACLVAVPAASAADGPAAAVQAAVTHPLVSVASPRTAWHPNQSNNWSGYNQGFLATGKTYHSISASWVVPTATQHTAGQAEYSATWVGIGGGCIDSGCLATDATLIQAGTEQDVASNGAASYSAWYELVPVPSLTITNVTVHPGDSMTVSLAETLPEVWSITVADNTDGQSYTTTVPYTSSYLTAEWIEETPVVVGGSGAGISALPNLSTVGFTGAKVDGVNANLDPSQEMQLVSSTNQVLATPSAPDSTRTAFNDCTYASSCPAP